MAVLLGMLGGDEGVWEIWWLVLGGKSGGEQRGRVCLLRRNNRRVSIEI